MTFDLAAFATKAGLELEFVTRLIDVGLLPSEGGLEEIHVPVARLASSMEDSGVPAEQLAAVIRSGALSLDYISRGFVRSAGMREGSFASLADDLGLSAEFAEEVALALGVPVSEESDLMREDDAGALTLLAGMVEAGIEESIVLRQFQIMTESSRRMTRAATEMWAEGVQRPLIDQGHSFTQLVEAQSLNGAKLQSIGRDLVDTLWSRYLDDEIFSGTVEILEAALREAGVEPESGSGLPAIAFMDLTAFTARTDAIGDDLAASDARELTDLLRRTVVSYRGSLVKMLGDGAMLHFPRSVDAVACALHLVERIPESGLPPARFGVNAGPIIVRDVDYFGHTVNVAARLVDYARPSEVLVTDQLVAALGEDHGHSLSEIGPVSLKGVASPVLVYGVSP